MASELLSTSFHQPSPFGLHKGVLHDGGLLERCGGVERLVCLRLCTAWWLKFSEDAHRLDKERSNLVNLHGANVTHLCSYEYRSDLVSDARSRLTRSCTWSTSFKPSLLLACRASRISCKIILILSGELTLSGALHITVSQVVRLAELRSTFPTVP